MSTEQLTREAMALPPAERVALARALWDSIHDGLPTVSEEEAVQIAKERARQLDSGEVVGVPYEEAMRHIRQAIGRE